MEDLLDEIETCYDFYSLNALLSEIYRFHDLKDVEIEAVNAKKKELIMKAS